MKLDARAYERYLDEARSRLHLMAPVFNPLKHPRGFGGRFSGTGGPGEAESAVGEATAGLERMGPPSPSLANKPLYEVPTRPPVHDWVDPPKPKGRKGQGKAGGFSATGKTNTEIGDLGEKIVEQLDLKSLLPPGKRQNPLDAEYDSTGYGFEIKTMTTAATQYRIKMKPHEIESKNSYAEANGLRPGLMAVILDADKGQAHVYWREGIKNVSMATPGWMHLGIVGLKD